MTMKNLLEGLQILLKYESAQDGEILAEHDTLTMGGPDPDELTPEDAARLAELRFSYDKLEECWNKFT